MSGVSPKVIGTAEGSGLGFSLQPLPGLGLPEVSKALESIFAHNLRCAAATVELVRTNVYARTPLERLTGRELWLRTCSESFLGCVEELDATTLHAACTLSDLAARSLEVEDRVAVAPVL